MGYVWACHNYARLPWFPVQLLAVWVMADWKSRGETTPLQLVELGPGRGTLLSDMLRVCGGGGVLELVEFGQLQGCQSLLRKNLNKSL